MENRLAPVLPEWRWPRECGVEATAVAELAEGSGPEEMTVLVNAPRKAAGTFSFRGWRNAARHVIASLQAEVEIAVQASAAAAYDETATRVRALDHEIQQHKGKVADITDEQESNKTALQAAKAEHVLVWVLSGHFD